MFDENANVYIVAMGTQNFLWPVAKDRNMIASYSDIDTHDALRIGDRAAYNDLVVGKRKTSDGKMATQITATGWFNKQKDLRDSVGDIWLRLTEHEIWWTVSTAEPMVYELADTPEHEIGRHGNKIFHLLKPCLQWSNETLDGRRLLKADIPDDYVNFLQSRSMKDNVRNEDALTFVRALIRGEAGLKQGSTAVSRAVMNAHYALVDRNRNANGQQELRRVKNKEYGLTYDQLLAWFQSQWDKQKGRCALTCVQMFLSKADDPTGERVFSIDRINSDGHYTIENMQLTCWFANRWKGAESDDDFKALLSMVRSVQ